MLEQLRDRIQYGRFLGLARPGDRLPSIREIASGEDVNRKTVAAAYVRLAREGLVEIRARSGIYLASGCQQSADGQLHRLRRQWLEQVYNGALAVGLSSGQILRIAGIVAEVERSRIPVLVSDLAEGVSLAEELRRRMGLNTDPVLIGESQQSNRTLLAGVAIAVCTPWYAPTLARIAPQCTNVPITLSSEVFRLLQDDAAGGLTLLVAADDVQSERIRIALDYFGKDLMARTVLLAAGRVDAGTFARFPFRKVVLWPGARLAAQPPAVVPIHVPDQLIAQEMLDSLRRAILDVALRKFAAASA